MKVTTVCFETSDFLAVHVENNLVLRCAIDLTDLGMQESLDDFLTRHGGSEATASYMRQLLRDGTARMMGLRKH
jgi:hypothetical protein